MPDTPLSSSAQKVQDTLKAFGFSNQVVEMPQTTRTSAEAAEAVGCGIGQIVKTVVFRGKQTGRAILVETSGANRVKEKKIAALVAESIEKADAEFVRAQTGYVIGGVPPVGHAQKLVTLIDEDLMQYGEIWAAAGTPNAVFKLTPAELVKMTGGQVASVRAE